MSRVEELYERTLELDPAELEEFLLHIASELADPPISKEWLEAAAERSRALASGETKGIPWSEVRERMYRRVNGSGH